MNLKTLDKAQYKIYEFMIGLCRKHSDKYEEKGGKYGKIM